MEPSDLTVQVFLLLRRTFFDVDGKPLSFFLRDKKNTQDDPLDEHLQQVLAAGLGDITCLKAPGPLITPDIVVFREERCRKARRQDLRTNLDNIIAVEVKKLERNLRGVIARRTGMDYNTTPPCGTVRVYDVDKRPLDVRCFYLFISLEQLSGALVRYIMSALALCDGNLLNEDFEYYLSIVGQRTKEIGIGTFGDGANRNRPMLIFANPLGITELNGKATLIHPRDNLEENSPDLRLTHVLQRTIPAGGIRQFYCYRFKNDIAPGWQVTTLLDPFPNPKRVNKTQPRGIFYLTFRVNR